jgi:hypothetical protein
MSRVMVLRQIGDVSQIYGVLPDHSSKINNMTSRGEYKQYKKENKESILKCLRYDNEKGLDRIPTTNPSKDTKDVIFHYNPVYYRQAIANNLPYQITNTITVIDSFACLGSRFGLQELMVFVEVYESSCGDGRIWAHIFYVADSEVPVCTIMVTKHRL